MPCLGEVGGVDDQQDQGDRGCELTVTRGSFCVGDGGVVGDARPANDPECLN